VPLNFLAFKRFQLACERCGFNCDDVSPDTGKFTKPNLGRQQWLL
jgi:hypothetical protein